MKGWKHLVLACAGCLTLAGAVRADEPRFANNPDGGSFYYQLQPSLSENATLKQIVTEGEARFGSKMTLKNLRRHKEDSTLTGFFEVTPADSQTPLKGMIIIGKVKRGCQVAVLYDTAERFPKTARQMLASLHSGKTARQTRPKLSQLGPVAVHIPVKTANFEDGTGTVGLPASWSLYKSGAGQAVVEGPAHERVLLNVAYFFGEPGTFDSSASQMVAGSFSGNAVQNWLTAVSARMRSLGKPVPDIQVTAAAQAGQSYVVDGLWAKNDGTGVYNFRAVLSGYRVSESAWILRESSIQLPQGTDTASYYAALAVVGSYRPSSSANLQSTTEFSNFQVAGSSPSPTPTSSYGNDGGYWIDEKPAPSSKKKPRSKSGGDYEDVNIDEFWKGK